MRSASVWFKSIKIFPEFTMRTLTITSLPFTLFDFLSDMRASKLRSFGPCNFTIPCLYRQLGSSIACILVALCPCNRCKAQCLCCRICRSKDSYRIRPISLHLELLECLWFWFKEFDRPTKRGCRETLVKVKLLVTQFRLFLVQSDPLKSSATLLQALSRMAQLDLLGCQDSRAP